MIAAVLFSVLMQMFLIAYSIATQKPGKDDSFACIIALTLSVIGSSIMLTRRRTDGFWKSFMLSCFTGFLPFLLYLVVVVTAISYGSRGLKFVLLMFGNLFAFAALCSLPIVALIHRFRFSRPVT